MTSNAQLGHAAPSRTSIQSMFVAGPSIKELSSVHRSAVKKSWFSLDRFTKSQTSKVTLWWTFLGATESLVSLLSSETGHFDL